MLPTREIVVSSAKRTVESGGRTLGKSLIKSENRVGPRIEPCGTPEVVEPGEDVELDTRVTWEYIQLVPITCTSTYNWYITLVPTTSKYYQY